MTATLKRARPAEMNGHVSGTAKTRKQQNRDSISENFNTVDELVRQRASEPGTSDEPIVSYPSHGTEYIDYTPSQLNTFAKNAALHYSTLIPARATSDDAVQVVALLGPSNFEYLVSLLALTKLGHTVLFLSTRISEEAHVSLLQRTQASLLLVDAAFQPMAQKVSKHLPTLQAGEILQREDYTAPTSDAPALQQHLDPLRETKNIAWIIHSSGSTGLPKPVFITHSAALGNYASPFSLVGFITLPLFHAHGLSCVFRAINKRRRIYIYNASLPLTSQHLTKTLTEHADIQIFYGVPYALKLLAESTAGTALLARCEVVMFGGSACPKPIGDKLVRAGVHLVGHFGSTETGQLMTSFRDREDLDWDFMRPSAQLQPFLRWEENGPGIFELVVLEGWPSKVATNREDGAYATKDLFEKHPTKNAWRYFARKDDTIVLMNGEKANPLLLEGVGRECPLVAEAILFGANKPHLGMYIVPASAAPSDQAAIEAVWPAIEEANARVPAYARLSKDMIRILPSGTEYRVTDKGTVIRAAFYKALAEQIDAIYEEAAPKGSLVLDEAGLRQYLRAELLKITNSERADFLKDDTDLFSLGVDSLQASQIRATILRNIDTGAQKMGQNFVFDFPSIQAMATELYRMRTGAPESQRLSVERRMQAMIEKYSSFERHVPQGESTDRECVLVTGATGSLGAHLVTQLATIPSVGEVFCLVRAPSDQAASERVAHSMKERRLYERFQSVENKVTTFSANLSDSHLGLERSTYDILASKVTAVVHCAWSVNFNLGLESFEKDCVAGTKHLIDLCLRAKRPTPASINFCSSVSSVAATPGNEAPEELPPSLSYAQGMGYAQSKLVTEHVCMRAAAQTGMTARVLRTGQIIGDTEHGIWNPQEAIPMIFQCAKTVGALPRLEETPSWLPVDTVASGLAELSLGAEAQNGVYNVVNHKTFHWTKDLLSMLRLAGLTFEELPQQEWVARLRASTPDPVANPPYKLLDFFASKYDTDVSRRSMTYLNDKAVASSSAIADAPLLSQAMVDKFVMYLSGAWSSQ